MSGQNINGFPFELEDQIGKGGFAAVYRGRFHQGQAAFKFVQIKDEQAYTYDINAVGCYEYRWQEMIKKKYQQSFYFVIIVFLNNNKRMRHTINLTKW